jgi:hypothetical protein
LIQRLAPIEIEGLEHQHVGGCRDEHCPEIDEMGVVPLALDISEIDAEAECRHEDEFDHSHRPGNHVGRQEIEIGASPDLGKARSRGTPPLGQHLRATQRSWRDQRLAVG